MLNVCRISSMFLFFGLLMAADGATAQRILIAAAADLKFALDSIVTIYREKNPESMVHVTYGSSGKLYEQIQRGAPFHIFFSADLIYPQRLHQQNLCFGDVVRYGEGRIVLWSVRKHTGNGADAFHSLTVNGIRKIAIANPLHAPYGKRAVETLIHYGVYDKVKTKLVYGENISQTAQFVTSGAADAGIIALSLALSPAMKRYGGTFAIIPRESHEPLEQGFVILQHARTNEEATRFAAYFNEDVSQRILTYFGFLNTP